MPRSALPGPPDLDADPRSPHSVRRALLPWRRRFRNFADFIILHRFVERNADELLGCLLFPVFVLFSVPALVVLMFAAVEFLFALLLVPSALLRRRMRKAWPVEVLDRRGRLLERTEHPTWQAAGDFAEDLRFERNLEQWV